MQLCHQQRFGFAAARCQRPDGGRQSFTRRKTSLRFSANAVILTLSRG
jgi:hypothetical protein